MQVIRFLAGVMRQGAAAPLVGAIAICVSPVMAANGQAKLPPPPPTKKEPVVDTYHGVKVTDDYRWLENGQSPAVKQWVAAQNAYSHAYLEPLPQRAPLVQYLQKTREQAHPSYQSLEYAGHCLFALKYDPEKSSPLLVIFDSPEKNASERTVVDLNTFLTGHASQVDWFLPSPDGKRVGMALSTGGSEDGALYVVDVATGKQVGDAVPRANFATGGGSMAWKQDGSGFYYTRYPQGNERPEADRNFYQQVYLHKLGTAASTDRYVAGKDFPRIAETTLAMSPDGRELLISVANGDGGEFEQFLVGADGEVKKVTHFDDKVVHAAFGPKDALYLLSRRQSDQGSILRLAADDVNFADAKTIISAPGKASLVSNGTGFPMSDRSYWVGENRIYATVIDGGPEEIRVFDHDGTALGRVPTPPVSSVSYLVPLDANAILYGVQTYTVPETWYRYTGSGQPEATGFRTESNVKLEDIEVRRAFARSKDGSEIPLTILMKKGTPLDGKNPTLITGYGGFGISWSPYFGGSAARLWFDHGGVWVETNLRGGGEYGEAGTRVECC